MKDNNDEWREKMLNESSQGMREFFTVNDLENISDEIFQEMCEVQLEIESWNRADQVEDLWDDGKKFLKENFNVDDVNALSDKDFNDLGRKLGSIEADEIVKLHRPGENLSEVGAIASGIVTYMGNQYTEGGRRYKGNENKD
jgi:hypothetical protein